MAVLHRTPRKTLDVLPAQLHHPDQAFEPQPMATLNHAHNHKRDLAAPCESVLAHPLTRVPPISTMLKPVAFAHPPPTPLVHPKASYIGYSRTPFEFHSTSRSPSAPTSSNRRFPSSSRHRHRSLSRSRSSCGRSLSSQSPKRSRAYCWRCSIEADLGPPPVPPHPPIGPRFAAVWTRLDKFVVQIDVSQKQHCSSFAGRYSQQFHGIITARNGSECHGCSRSLGQLGIQLGELQADLQQAYGDGLQDYNDGVTQGEFRNSQL
ncbi:hypothetical protein PCASD_26914 [Puccinia coronata f. sp. avenae]|uniref:Uncharacterized protein n=1 Tax=Puccinia coronata f. sp. avenae TaxID=200324 RepID=A0A2N5RWB6_9BASI|nr:hypothetical protein PCASD_26914 [Puccinia coronata f. sp. avenae]